MKNKGNLNVFKINLSVPTEIKIYFYTTNINKFKDFNHLIKTVFPYYINNPSKINYNPKIILTFENNINQKNNLSFYLNNKIKNKLNSLASSNLRDRSNQSKLILYIIYLNLLKDSNYYQFLL
jgi:hypothetical protein